MSPRRHDVVLISTADWDATLWTNKQHTARALRDQGCRVLFVESLGLRPPSLGKVDLLRMARRARRLFARPTQVEERLWRWSPPSIPFQRVALVRMVNRTVVSLLLRFWTRRLLSPRPLLWTYNPLTTALVRPDEGAELVYHCVDDIAAQPGMPVREIDRFETELIKAASVVFVTSRALEAKWSMFRPVVYEANCVDFRHFATRATEQGDPLEGIPHPRLAFVGALAAYKVDTALLLSICKARPAWSLVIIGPRADNDDSVTALLRLPNVHHVGTRRYAELPRFMQAMDVGLIPALENPYTESMFPMKFFEYLASGLPVVGTPLSALKEFSAVATFAPADRFLEAIERVLVGDVPAPEDRARVAEAHTYEARTVRMLHVIDADADARDRLAQRL